MILVICGNRMPTRCNRGFYCKSYCLLNVFQAPLCPSSGAQDYYTMVAGCCSKFNIALRKFLQTHSFYSLDELFDKQWYSLVYIPLSYISTGIYWNIFCVKFTSILCISVLYLYCLFFKCMASYTTEPIYWLFLHPLDTFLYWKFGK